MKKSPYIILAALALLLTGCGTLSPYRPILGTNQVPAHIEQKLSLATNLTSVIRTNSLGEVQMAVQTNLVQTITPIYVPATFTIVTNGWEIAHGVDTATQVVGGLVNIAAPGIGSAVSYAASGLLTLGLLYLNRKAKRAQGQQQTAEELNVGLIKAVEDFRIGVKLTPLGEKVDDHLIDQIKAHIPDATAAGVLLSSLVDKHTGNTANAAQFVREMGKPS